MNYLSTTIACVRDSQFTLNGQKFNQAANVSGSIRIAIPFFLLNIFVIHALKSFKWTSKRGSLGIIGWYVFFKGTTGILFLIILILNILYSKLEYRLSTWGGLVLCISPSASEMMSQDILWSLYFVVSEELLAIVFALDA